MSNENKLTIEQVAMAAYMAMDASNVSGLVRSWAEWQPTIREHAEKIGIPPNQHAINMIMADKIRQLSCPDSMTIDDDIFHAYGVVSALRGPM